MANMSTEYNGINRTTIAGFLFSIFLLILLYFYIKPPSWLFFAVFIFMAITHIEEIFNFDGLFGVAASLLLIGGGVGGIISSEAVVVSTLAIIAGIIAAYRSISEFRTNIAT